MSANWDDPLIEEFKRAFSTAFGGGHARHFRIAPVNGMFRIEKIIKGAFFIEDGTKVYEPFSRDYTEQELQKLVDRLKTYGTHKGDTSPLGW